ncbi:MAG TPA: hypothetical protein VN704_07850 [Verrucomicrobiae bacterium]|nr:hypothetical protein [Verrucomicrobiae bacterium]
MFVAYWFISKVVDKHGRLHVSTVGGTWYPQACHFLKLKHHIYFLHEKRIGERTMQTSKIEL